MLVTKKGCLCSRDTIELKVVYMTGEKRRVLVFPFYKNFNTYNAVLLMQNHKHTAPSIDPVVCGQEYKNAEVLLVVLARVLDPPKTGGLLFYK